MSKINLDRSILATYIISMAQTSHDHEPIYRGKTLHQEQKPKGNQERLKKKKAKAKQIKRLHIMEKRRRK